MPTERVHSTYSEKTAVWGHLGYAIMKCQVLEHRLADVLFLCELLNETYRCGQMREKIAVYQKQTMGWLKNRILDVAKVPPSIALQLQEVCDIRNELAHRYFKTRMELLHTKQGFEIMAAELSEKYEKVEQLIDYFHQVSVQLGAPLGYSSEAVGKVRTQIEEYLAGLPEADLERMRRAVAE